MCYAYIIKSLDVEKKIRNTLMINEMITIFFKSLTCFFRFWPIPILFLSNNYTVNSQWVAVGMRINMTGTDSDISDTELPVRTCRAKKKNALDSQSVHL